MSSSQKFPHRPSRKPTASQSARSQRPLVPPPKRDQRPRPGLPRSPQRDPAPSGASPGAMPMGETAALKHQLTTSPVAVAETTPLESPRRKRFLSNWTLWAFIMLGGLGAIVGASAVSLLRIPNLPNCRAIFWPTASAATRLQCADAYADQGSVDSLLAAIALVEALPDDHPLRSDINERVELWANQILSIADDTFHQGELEEAIKIAGKIPTNTAAADEVSDRIAAWRETWEQAESIFREAEGHLKDLEFREAFSAAIQLRAVDNEHWANARYEELVGLITKTREEVNILANAERTAQGGTLEDVLTALEQVAAIGKNSYVYETAQQTLKQLSRQLLDLAEDALLRRRSAEATDILNKIPPEAELGAEIADFRTLIDAYELTWAGTTVGYEAAIVRLQSISSDRPLYARAQELKQQWQWQLGAIAQLNWARQIAQPGSPQALRAAIAEAEKIEGSSPAWEDAQEQIQRWRETIAVIEDQPYLDRARLLASRGDRAALQGAIAEASSIPSSSFLYDEAQENIADWRWRIQKMDNGPILEQARQLAQSGQLSQAIAVASQIPPNQALFDEAQSAISEWQDTQQGSQAYQQALLMAQTGTVDALVDAIELAQTVPETSENWPQAQQAVNQWSWDLLGMAEVAATQDVQQGIAIASQVPPRSEAYAEAQLRLRDWQAALTPPAQ